MYFFKVNLDYFFSGAEFPVITPLVLCRDTAMVCSISFLFYTFYVVITEKNSTDEKYRTGEKLDFLKD